MAESKDASMDLKSELAELEGLEGNLDTTTDVSADLVEMKNRMDKSDQEMRAMTEAMKSTLLDVRTLMQDMDNPFNMLRDMGVDKLVTKAVETVEEEVNQKKNEDAKNKMAGVDEENSQSPVVAKIEGSTTNHPGLISNQAAPVTQAPSIPQPAGSPIIAASNQGSNIPQVTNVPQTGAQIAQPMNASNGTPVADESSIGVSPVPGVASGVSHPASQISSTPPTGDQVQQLVPRTESKPYSSMSHSNPIVQTEPMYSNFEERIYQTEASVNNLANTVGELVKTIRTQRTAPRKVESVYSDNSDPTEFYEAYVGLVSDYMYIRLGDRGAEEILLEGMYKEWASPKVVRDIMDKLSTKKQRRGKSVTEEANIEDRMLITTLLRNLDKDPSEWSNSTHLFMLMALVSRAKENTS
jgi:hypothetical protein